MLGGPVFGGEFFDREKLMAELKRDIHHAHHALIGPRGCGKSSILKQLATAEKVDDLISIYIDVARVVPRTHRNVVKKLGREALRAVVKERGVIRSMPALVREKMAKVADFVRENLRVRVSDWLTLYFDPNADLTELMEQTFATIESYGVGMLVMLDEITSLMRLSGPQPKGEDMDFMEALRGHVSEARRARYIFCGSQVGLMNLIVKMKFGRLLVAKEVGGLEDKGVEDLIRAKIRYKVPEEFVEDLKKRTRCWPLYLQAYCLAANLHGKKPISPTDLDEKVFNLLHMHFLYLESQLSDLELLVLLSLEDGKVSELSSKLGVPYNTLLTALRTLDLKGFVKKISPGTYAPLDSIFSTWLRREYEKPG